MSPQPDSAAVGRNLPLQGVRVLDLSMYLPGPAATLLLAQLGAQVTKVEPPGGDPARYMGQRRHDSSQVFVALQRGKQLLTLDLKQEAGRAQLLQMAEDADVLVEGFRPGVMQRLGLGWDTLHAQNPRLVLCSISGYGQMGPYRQRAGHDINYLGYAGVLAQATDREGRPILSGLPLADLFGGAQTAVIGLLAALLAVRQTGQGSHVDVSMSNAMFAGNIMAAASVNVEGAEPQAGNDLLTGGAPCYNVYRTADARYMAVGALEHKYWVLMCEVLQCPELADEHWSCGQTPGSLEADATRVKIEQLFGRKTQMQWVTLFDKHDCCVTPVLSMEEAMRHPVFVQDDMLETYDFAVEGQSSFPAMPLRFHP